MVNSRPFREISRIAIGSALAFSGAVAAQDAQEPVSREVVQPLPPAETADLTEALRRIAADPRDAEALLLAGRASLILEDADAAMGFFTRARDLGTVNGQAKAGQAAALVYRKMPVEALRLFAEADAEGVSPLTFAADYGLALDLVGDNVRAQNYYRMALRDHPDEEVTRRLALSLAIGGDQAASEMALLPQLQRQDLASYRTRAFALAALGKTEEAVAIAEAIMPASLAARIAPYLRYMPKLTRAQQAAAGNFGHFPEASAIGKDDPRIEALARAAGGTRLVSSAADGRLVPVGEPLGAAARPAPPPAGPRIEIVPEQAPPVAARVAVAEPVQVVDELPPPDLGVPVEPAPAGEIAIGFAVEDAEPGDSELPDPGFSVDLADPYSEAGPGDAGIDLAGLAANRSGTIAPEEVAPGEVGETVPELEPIVDTGSEPEQPAPPEPEPEPPAAESRPASLADAFADFGAPTGSADPASGAVDITAIEPAREARSEPPKPALPSRIWVQVATGRDRAALGFDWRRIVREGGAAMQGRSGYVARWGQTNRLVTGPFDSRQRAQAFVAALKEEGIDSFLFTSAEGEAVDPLPRR